MPRNSKNLTAESLRILKSGRGTRTCRRLLESGQAEALGYFSPSGIYSVDVAESVVYRHVCLRSKVPLDPLPKLQRASEFSKWLCSKLKTSGFFSP